MKKRKQKNVLLVIIGVYLAAFLMFALKIEGAEKAGVVAPAATTANSTKTETKKEIGKAKSMHAVMSLKHGDKDLGKIRIKLFHTEAPNTVDNFVSLAEGINPKTKEKLKNKFYDGLIFHRVIPDFMIQGGDPTGTGRGDPGYKFDDEIAGNPKRHSKPGILSMANSRPNSNGSQFFITVAATGWLDGKHTVFGEVVEGMDIVNKISLVPRDHENRPNVPVTMSSVVIERQ